MTFDSEAALPADDLLHRLVSLAPLPGSRAELAATLACGEDELAAALEFLNRLGVSLEESPGGLRLAGAADLLLPGQVAPLLQTRRLGRRIVHFFSLDSTQQAAISAARQGEPEGTVFVAELQTAGRGRHGHRWQSAPGQGISFTLLLRPEGTPADLLPATLAAGLAVAEAVQAVTGLQPDIRWPNDLLLHGRKFCGILLEMSAEAHRVQHALLGIGVNVHQRDFGPELAPIATSLAAVCGQKLSRPRLLAEILFRLEQWLDRLRREGRGPILAAFEATSSYARGLPVRVGSGPEVYTGVTAGLDKDGFLLVRREDGALETVLSGDVRPQ